MRLLDRRSARFGLALVAIAAIGVAFVRTLDEAEGVPLPSVARVGAAAAVLTIGMLTAGAAWVVLVPGPPRRSLLAGFFLAQLGKYVPGAVWQGVGQIVDAGRLGVARGTALVAYLVQIATQVVAGAGVAALVLVSRPSGWLLAAGLLAPLTLLGLRRGWMRVVLRTGVRVAPSRFGHLPDTLPEQWRILAATGFGAVTMVAVSSAYGLFLEVNSLHGLLMGVGAFALAWTLGFLVVPVPSGLGVREFALVAALGAEYGTAAVLASAVLLRLILIVVEAALAAAAAVVRARHGAPDPNGASKPTDGRS